MEVDVRDRGKRTGTYKAWKQEFEIRIRKMYQIQDKIIKGVSSLSKRKKVRDIGKISTYYDIMNITKSDVIQ